LDEQTTNILGVEVPLVTIPVSSGRNLAAIIETAAINARLKDAGYRSAQIFVDNIAKHNKKEGEKKEREAARQKERETMQKLEEKAREKTEDLQADLKKLAQKQSAKEHS
jgi:HPr kinase/phosphorylase